jgi:hypothetical protein
MDGIEEMAVGEHELQGVGLVKSVPDITRLRVSVYADNQKTRIPIPHGGTACLAKKI